ncbi:MAG: sigma-B regulation protein RsbU (phosphoserine phosphatase) [Anaerolineaceae bacterium]|nr:MAG: sigma-B regulation protein RsbU (phosphoserine phosphatase) [Anaerolineaceae bacterium]
MKRLIAFFNQSFQRKLLLFNLATVIITTVVLYLFLMYNFRSITDFSLERSSASMQKTVQEFLERLVEEKSNSTWLQLKAAQDNLSVLGRTAQNMVDNSAYLATDPMLYQIPLFQTVLHEEHGALTSDSSAPVDALVPPSLANDPRAVQQLELSAVLNLSMAAVFEANDNNAFVYYVGGPATPVTRAYPNYHLAEVLNDQGILDSLFWKDFFAPNVASWTRWYTDPQLQAEIPSPVTVEKPYVDAAGQGLIVTMFYPLWDKQTNQFAGAVGVDITLNAIVENILSIQIAETGFAFLMDGQGNIIAMPEVGSQLFQVEFTKTELGDLVYYKGALTDSRDPVVRNLAAAILANPSGSQQIDLTDASGQVHREMLAYNSLPPLSDSNYQADSWKIVVVVPEAEISEAINQTRTDIEQERLRISLISLVIAAAFLVAVTLISVRFANNSTRDLRLLSHAAGAIKAKNYDVALDLKSQDEIGGLGRIFTSMAAEIREYTVNLEGKVAERTADLRTANEEITRLNDQLRGENLRLGAELDVARRLQMMVLPPENETSEIPDLDIACYMRPADEVGGDYYDVLRVGDTVYMGIGDVTGHGLPAGVIMLMAQTALLTLSKSGEQNMERMLSVLNQVLYKNILRIQEDKNMTLAILQYNDHEFSMVGQHEAALICRTSGEVEVADTMDLGMPVGLEENIDRFIMTSRFHLDRGDVLLLYTDGATEAVNAKKKQFSLSGLSASLARHHKLHAKDIVKHMLADVFAHIGEAHIYDDIALLVIKQK